MLSSCVLIRLLKALLEAMALRCFLYFVLLLLEVSVLEGRKKVRHNTVKVTRIEKMQMCPDFKFNDFVLTWLDVEELKGGTNVLNANVSVGIDAPPKLQLRATVKKCSTLDYSSCELFIKSTVDFCNLLEDKDKWYSKMFDLQPPLHCPIKKGLYYLRNATIDTSEMLKFVGGFFPPEFYGYHWWYRIYFGRKSAEDLFCMDAVIKMYTRYNY